MSLAREAFGTACSSYQSRSLTLWLLDSLAPKELIRTILDKVRAQGRLSYRELGSAAAISALHQTADQGLSFPNRGRCSR